MRQNIIDDDYRPKQSVWAELPPFVKYESGFIDGWNPDEPSGDFDLDFLTGGLFADIAVKHAREIKNPAFIGFVMAAIYFKTTKGMLSMGGLEQGFLDRIARLAYAGSLN